jgi:molybdopterin-guanine dinucleotide biosynthesis protein A
VSGRPWGAVLAGGQSLRYGTPKMLDRVAGRRIIDRVLDTLAGVPVDPVLLANDPAIAAAVGLPWRPDARPGAGALSGIHTGLAWARETGRPGMLAVAADMPFVPASLLAALLERAVADDRPAVVAPASPGPRGIEPLCAWYAVTALPAVEAALERGDHRMVGFHADVAVARLERDAVSAHGSPDLIFLNVNTPADRERAERLVASAESS